MRLKFGTWLLLGLASLQLLIVMMPVAGGTPICLGYRDSWGRITCPGSDAPGCPCP